MVYLGSILGPLLFNLFINDIFYFLIESKLANYADDTSTYLSKEGIFPFLHASPKLRLFLTGLRGMK